MSYMNTSSTCFTLPEFRVSLISFISVLCLLVVSCKQEEPSDGATSKQIQSSPQPEAAPNPSGTYADAEGGMTYTFLSTGKFYSDVLGDTYFGTWSRVGDNVEITYDDGNAESVTLGDDFVVAHGLRLHKR